MTADEKKIFWIVLGIIISLLWTIAQAHGVTRLLATSQFDLLQAAYPAREKV